MFFFSQKQGNSAAHNIARRVSEFSIWMENVLPHLFSIILADAAVL